MRWMVGGLRVRKAAAPARPALGQWMLRCPSCVHVAVVANKTTSAPAFHQLLAEQASYLDGLTHNN